MLQRLGEGLNLRLSRLFPERQLVVRSDDASRFIRLPPLAQASALAIAIELAGWTGVASFQLVDASMRAGAADDELARASAAYEARIALLEGRAMRMAEALSTARSDEHLAVERLDAQHAMLTNSMSSEREIAAQLQSQKSRFMSLAAEHDSALKLCEATERRVSILEAALNAKTQKAEALASVLDALNRKLGDVANARNDAAETTQSLVLQVDALSAEISERAERQNRVFAQLEDAAKLSLGELENVFEQSGVKLEPILDAVRKEQGGEGGPFIPAAEMESLEKADNASAARLASLMERLERVNLLRIAVEKMPFARPVSSARLSSTFGYRRDPKNGRSAYHTGVDLANHRGTAIHATAEGRVAYAGWRRGYGKVVEIEHAFGYETVYGHLSRIRVKVGDHVSRGDRIGDMGSTGRSTGNHVHYEVRVGGKPVNPLNYIEAARNVL